ncbi:hypothetical protein ACVWWR_002761 [Bradyrhizobium sp. LM3.2]
MEDGLQARHVVGIAHVLRQRPDPVHHGRHEIDPLHALARDLSQRLLRVELDEAGELAAGKQRVVRHDERSIVVERAGIEQRDPEGDVERRRGDRVGHRRLVIEDHLRPAGFEPPLVMAFQ